MSDDHAAAANIIEYSKAGHLMMYTRDYDISDRADHELVVLASMWEYIMYGADEPMGRPAAEYGWEVVDFPIADIASRPDDWKAWMQEENQNCVEYGDPDRYTGILTEDIREEVVLVLCEDEQGVTGGYLWDGYHRTAATVVKGGTTVRAIVGRLLPEYALSSTPALR